MRQLRCCIASAVCLIILAGCSAAIPTPAPKRTADPPLSHSIPAPARWSDVTDKALSPDVEYWLVAGDRSASLLLKELQPSKPPAVIPADESILTVAHLSLRLKLAELGNGIRITQTPALFEPDRALAVYAYSEKGLLRRVIVFRKRSRLYELELVQEKEEEALAGHLAAQITFAEAIVRE